MSRISVTNCAVLRNPACFREPLEFEVTFECNGGLSGDLEWSVVYVASADDSSKDQVLEELLVGPIQNGTNRFVLQAPAPDISSIPPSDLLGVTVILIMGSYCGSEFVRIGYYVNNSHSDPEVNLAATEGRLEQLTSLPPGEITRNILAGKPRVTRFVIDWHQEHMLQTEEEEDNDFTMTSTSPEPSAAYMMQPQKAFLNSSVDGSSMGMEVVEVRY